MFFSKIYCIDKKTAHVLIFNSIYALVNKLAYNDVISTVRYPISVDMPKIYDNKILKIILD